jgi:hypothetical protein
MGRWTVARALVSYVRVWPYLPTANRPAVRTLLKTVSESRDFAVSLVECPETRAGQTVHTAHPVSGGTGLTFGTPAATTAPFDGIPAGKCIRFRISGGTAGTEPPRWRRRPSRTTRRRCTPCRPFPR